MTIVIQKLHFLSLMYTNLYMCQFNVFVIYWKAKIVIVVFVFEQTNCVIQIISDKSEYFIEIFKMNRPNYLTSEEVEEEILMLTVNPKKVQMILCRKVKVITVMTMTRKLKTKTVESNCLFQIQMWTHCISQKMAPFGAHNRFKCKVQDFDRKT